MRNVNSLSNISALFQSSSKSSSKSSSSANLGIDLGEYAAIKNGSYRKLVKSYYSSDEKSASKTGASSVLKTSDDTKALKSMKTEADSLQTAVSELMGDDTWKKTDGSLDTDKVEKAVKNFVNSYNSVLDQADKVSNSDVTQQTNWMSSMTSTMSNALSKVGISVAADGKLSVDTDKLANADEKNLTSLFKGKNSYASQIQTKAGAIGSAAVRNTSLYTNGGTLANSYLNTYNQQT